MSDLETRLREAAGASVLLVATDYDGTLAPIVEDPAEAKPRREAVAALRLLASLPRTHVAVISGRSLEDLAGLLGPVEGVHLVGSHGSEFDAGFAAGLQPEQRELRERVLEDLHALAADVPGALVEAKPASIALHYRKVDPVAAEELREKAFDGPGSREGVHPKEGKMVVEFGVVPTDKGRALDVMRRQVGATTVIFLGDDRTDEDAFATLRGPDLGVKVGDGETAASHRVEDPEEVARFLAGLGELRRDLLEVETATPIEQHSLLSDHRTLALVDPRGSLVWTCFPRVDSGALFAALLGGPAAGDFRIQPEDGTDQPEQVYRESSLVLETRWQDVTLTDFLDCSEGRPFRRAGRSELVRKVEGTGAVRIRFAPRLDFGRVPTRLAVRDDGLVVEAWRDPIVLRAPGVVWTLVEEGLHHTAEARVELDPDRPLWLELRYGTGSLRAGKPDAAERLQLTEAYWSSWAAGLTLPDHHTELLRRSAITLSGLVYRPTGAMVAAGTTSLPEWIGGMRNWDYRFCWIRDTALAMTALVELDSTEEAMRYLDWLFAVVGRCESPERLLPLYTVSGEELGPEGEITELAGYRGSRPVRVGNAAASQVQLDVFGPVVDLVARLADRDAPLSSEHWRLVEAMVKAVEERWREPDHGIWEIRKPARHHVHSKVMCWMAVDRAQRVARSFLDTEHPEWNELRDAIAADVLEKGYKESVGAFTAAYDGDDLDAAALWVGLSGLLPPDDPRFRGTVEAVERNLHCDGIVYRYRDDDGLAGTEGGFPLCASWLVDSFLRLGRNEDARSLFESICEQAGPTGLLGEQYDPDTETVLGNFPQAYSHLGILGNALRLAEAGA